MIVGVHVHVRDLCLWCWCPIDLLRFSPPELLKTKQKKSTFLGRGTWQKSCHRLVLYPLKNVTNAEFSRLTESNTRGGGRAWEPLIRGSVGGCRRGRVGDVSTRKKKKAAAIPTSEQPERAAAASSKALQFHFYFQMMALLIAFCIPCSSVVSFYGVFHRALEGLPWRLAQSLIIDCAGWRRLRTPWGGFQVTATHNIKWLNQSQ